MNSYEHQWTENETKVMHDDPISPALLVVLRSFGSNIDGDEAIPSELCAKLDSWVPADRHAGTSDIAQVKEMRRLR